ncbi:MAG: thiolase family protein [Ilumatobacteraceae bacterium]
MNQVWITGVGTSSFGRLADQTPGDLVATAVTEAMDDAGVTPADLDAIYLGSVFGAPGIANRVTDHAGLHGVPIIRLEAACASGTSAFHEAVQNVGHGRFRTVLAVGVEHMSSTFPRGPIVPEPTDREQRTGLALPALYALQAHRYLHDTGTPAEAIAGVAVKNKRHGSMNPRAHLAKGDVTLDEVLAAPMVADPLTRLQCCPLTDGAAAAVVSAERSETRPTCVEVLASDMVSGIPWGAASTDRYWGVGPVRRAAAAAYALAGVTATDVHVAEVHDAFTIGEVLAVEALGLAGPGTAARRIADGGFAIGSADGPTINPSGGLLSRGHPLGATGLAQLAEITWQLRGEAADRQVDDARVGLVETMGGGAAGVDGNAAVVTILRRTP